MRANEQQAVEAPHQLVDAVVSGAGIVYVSGDELASCPLSAESKHSKKAQQKKDDLLQCDGQRTAGDWQRTRERIDELSKMPGGLIAVQRDKLCDAGRIAEMQVEFSIQSQSAMTIMPVQDREAFISLVAIRSKTTHVAGPDRKGRLSAGAPPCITDRQLRRLLTCLPAIDDPTAHKLLARFRTVAGVLTAEEGEIQSAAGLKADQAKKLYRLLQCCRGHSTYSASRNGKLPAPAR